MVNQVTAQKIKKNFDKPYDVAVKYYALLSLLNNLNLTDREIQLLAHIAIKGTISTVPSKTEFIKNHKTTLNTVNNLISALSKRGFLVKTNKMIRLHPKISVNFNGVDEVIINIRCILPNELKQE